MRKPLGASLILILILFILLFAGCGEDSSDSGLYDQIVEGTTNEINLSEDGISLDIEYMDDEEIEDAIRGIKPSIETTDIQIVRDFKEDEWKAWEKYEGKIVQVKGTISDVSLHRYDTMDLSDEVSLLGDTQSQKDYPHARFECVFAPGHDEELIALEEGVEVTIKGCFAWGQAEGKEYGTFGLQGCTIVNDYRIEYSASSVVGTYELEDGNTRLVCMPDGTCVRDETQSGEPAWRGTYEVEGSKLYWDEADTHTTWFKEYEIEDGGSKLTMGVYTFIKVSDSYDISDIPESRIRD